MDTVNIPNQTLSLLLTGNLTCEFNFLALKILLTRLQMKIRKDPQPYTIAACVTELQEFLHKMRQLPAAQKDIEKILQLRSQS